MNDKAFLKLPRVLISEPLRRKLSDSAIVLYSYLLSLYELSVRNGERFRDKNGRCYVVCPISTVMRLLNCCNNKAESVYLQLENQNLISRKRQGLGKANLIYVNPIVESISTCAKNTLDLCEKIDSANAKITLTEMGKTHTIKNDYYQKDLNNNYPSISYGDAIEDIRNQIEYDVLAERGYGSVLDEIVSLLADTVTSAAETVRINQINIPTEKVRWRLKQLTAEHIEYVISSLEKNTTEIKNMRAYLLTALYNSIDTLDTAALYGA
jgi:hypothetical protein